MAEDFTYASCDELDNLPALHKDNWLKEVELLSKIVKPGSSVLQIGCAEGDRILFLSKSIKNVEWVGVDIVAAYAERFEKKLSGSGVNTKFVLGDICKPLGLERKFDYVLCLNNTLGYIHDNPAAINGMRKYLKKGGKIVISVYSASKFSNELAVKYFESIGTKLVKRFGNLFRTEDFSLKVYTEPDLLDIMNIEKIIPTPLGFVCVGT